MEEPLQLSGTARAESLGRSLSRDQPLLFCRQRWGFLAAEDHLPLPAFSHGRAHKWHPVAYGTGLVSLHNQFDLTERTFLKVCIPCPFYSRQNDGNTCVSFVIAAGCEGAKYIGVFILTPSFPPTQSWAEVFLLGLLYKRITFHTVETLNLVPSTMCNKNETKYLKLVLRN